MLNAKQSPKAKYHWSKEKIMECSNKVRKKTLKKADFFSMYYNLSVSLMRFLLDLLIAYTLISIRLYWANFVEVRHTNLVGVTYSYLFYSDCQEIIIFYFCFISAIENFISAIERLICNTFMFLQIMTTSGPNMKCHIINSCIWVTRLLHSCFEYILFQVSSLSFS